MNQEKIGKFICKIRKEKNMTQEELANILEVTSSAVGNWENGRRLPDYSILRNLCNALDITFDDFFAGELVKEKNERKKSENTILSILEFESRIKKKYKLYLLSSILLGIIIALMLFLSIYFINNYNSIHAYELSGKSEHFLYSGTLITTKIKNFYSSGEITIPINPDKIKILYTALKCDDRVIVGVSGDLTGTYIENYGYEEMFSKKVLQNLDNWYLEVTYEENGIKKEEIINLTNENIMNNNNIFSKKVDSISYDDSTLYNEPTKEQKERMNSIIEFLKNHNFEDKTTPRIIEEKQPITKKCTFYKKLSDNSSYLIDIYYKIEIIMYSGKEYDVTITLGSKYFHIVGKNNNKGYTYIYNAKDNMGYCSDGECPNDFIKEARIYYEKYKKEFEGLHYFVDFEYPVDYDEDI